MNEPSKPPKTESKKDPVDAKNIKDKIKNAFNKDTIQGKLIQISLGLLVVFLIYFIALKVLNSSSLSSYDPTNLYVKKDVIIIDGYADSSQLSYMTYNTVLPFANNSLSIIPSSNIKGGAQFTYSLWINTKSGHDEEYIRKPIFLRGEAAKYTYKVKDTYTNITNTETDYVAFSPMLCFGETSLDFVVRFNTADNMNEKLVVSRLNDPNNLYRQNLMSLYNGKWALLTIVFEDNIPLNDFENGLSVKFYINEQLYETGTYSTMLKQNTGNLYIFPEGAVSGCMISNFAYYNYALGITEIMNLYRAGPSNKSTSTVMKSFISPLMLSDRNRLDIYNA